MRISKSNIKTGFSTSSRPIPASLPPPTPSSLPSLWLVAIVSVRIPFHFVLVCLTLLSLPLYIPQVSPSTPNGPQLRRGVVPCLRQTDHAQALHRLRLPPSARPAPRRRPPFS